MEPKHLPVRDAGCYVNNECVYTHDCGEKDFEHCKVTVVQDSYTQETARAVATLMQKHRVRPHVVTNLLHRNRLDTNREKKEAAFGVPEAVQAWEFWHYLIEKCKGHGRALYIDMHGVSSHPEKWVELGYLISRTDLDDNNFGYRDSSIRHLAERSEYSFDSILRGRQSLGYLFDRKGYKTVPSPSYPSPNGGKYYRGGTNTRIHGSKYGGYVDAIQIEMPKHLRNETACYEEEYCQNLADILYDFWSAHYKF